MVNYKDYALRFLDESRDSLRLQSYLQELLKVYVVDNATSDESMSSLAQQYPEAILIPRPDGNYSAANNAGIEAAKKDGCDYFIIANMDTKFDKDWVSELVKAIESDSKIGIAQSKILLYPKEGEAVKINSLGNIVHFLGFGFTSGYGEPDRDIEGLPEILGYASGCSFIISKEVLDVIGGYNEEYYMYHDDVEMSLKAKYAGYKIILAPKSIVFHKYEFTRSIRMFYFMERNRYLAMLHFYSVPAIILLAPAILFMESGILLFSVFNGSLSSKFKIYKYFLAAESWEKISAARSHINKIKKIKESEFIKDFQGRILFQEIDNPLLKYFANPILNAYRKIVKGIIIW